ncbi:MAG: hypothetical protein WA667_21595 [Candidatus Nitrosopolaris sp.]
MQRLDLGKKFFVWRALSALGISLIADALDFIEGPILTIPPIGDIPNAIITGLLFAITRNKRSAAINLIKFIPIIGDYIPTYTITTLMWIYTEWSKKNETANISDPVMHNVRI